MKPEKAQLVIQGLKEAGVDFAAGVPDAQFIEVYKMLAEDRDIHYVGAANEAEATGIGFGASDCRLVVCRREHAKENRICRMSPGRAKRKGERL